MRLTTLDTRQLSRNVADIDREIKAQASKLTYHIEAIKLRLESLEDDLSMSTGRKRNRVNASIESLESTLDMAEKINAGINIGVGMSARKANNTQMEAGE